MGFGASGTWLFNRRKKGISPQVIEEVRRLAAGGAKLTCWSSGGAEYAQEVATELGIEDCLERFGAKPSLMIDDQSPSEWRYLEVVHPNEPAWC